MRRTILVMVALSLAACTSESESEPAPAAETAMSSPARWVPVRAATGRSMALPAIVVADPQGAAEVTALYSGQVQKVMVQPGDAVAEGAPLAELAAPELAAAVAELASARRQLELLRARLASLADLRKAGLARQSQVFELEARVAELEAKEGLAAAQLRSRGLSGVDRRSLATTGRLVLKSPVAGVVTDVHVHLGQTVSPDGRPLVQVQGRGSVRVEVQLPAPLPESAALELRGHDGRRHALKTPAVASVVDPETGTLRAWFELAEDRLPSGLRGEVQVRAADGAWFEVPTKAIARKGDGAEIFLRRKGEARWVPVRVEAESGAVALVQGELQKGDEVLADASAAPQPKATTDAS